MIQEEIREKTSEHFIRMYKKRTVDFGHTREIMEGKIIQENKTEEL